MPRSTRRHALRPQLDFLDDRCLLSAMSPAQVAQAYGLNAVGLTSSTGQALKGDGTGQTIAIVDAYHDPYLASDILTFDNQFGLAAAKVSQVNQAGSATDDGWAGEEMLDVEWAHAMAPGANIVVVEAKSDSISDLMNAVNTARNLPGVSVVSMSWGGGEFNGQTAYDSDFTTPAGHTGVTFLASSGDSGPQAGAEWPASSPNVVSVGGTTLRVATGGGYGSESMWSGSGGGSSQVYAEPSYQDSLQSTGRRSSPDVLFNADPNTGVAVYTTAPSTGRGQWEQVGGTSLGAPAWAGIVAIADQGRAARGLGSLDGATQTLPALYAAPKADFHAVAAPSSPGHYSYVVIGRWIYLVYVPGTAGTPSLGSPNGSALIGSLVSYGSGSSTATNAAHTSTTTTTAATTTTTQGSGGTTTTPRGGSPWGGWGRWFDVRVPATADGGTVVAQASTSTTGLPIAPLAPPATSSATLDHARTVASAFELALHELGWDA